MSCARQVVQRTENLSGDEIQLAGYIATLSRNIRVEMESLWFGPNKVNAERARGGEMLG